MSVVLGAFSEAKTLCRRHSPTIKRSQFIARGIVPGKGCLTRGNFGQFS
jgi:hypothetical protein